MVDPWQSHQDDITCTVLWLRDAILSDGDSPDHPLWTEVRELEKLLDNKDAK